MLLFFVFVAIFSQSFAQHFVKQTVSTNHEQPAVVDEDLFRKFTQWQQSIQNQNIQEEDNFNHLKSGYNNQYGGNPWLQPTQAPQPPPTTVPPYVDPNPNNPWINQGSQGGVYVPPSNGGYFPTQTQPPPPPPPQNQGGYYPGVTQGPPQSGGYVPPPAATSPPESPEVAALRRYCLKPRGQFPSKSCNKYVNCWDDVIVEQECPSGLLFSPKGYCDYDFNVDCQGRPAQPAPAPPTLPAGEGHCPSLFGNYRNKANCSEFFVCNHGIPIKFSCPSGLYYSTELGVCDYPYNVDCINPRPLNPSPAPELPPPYPINNNPYYLQRVPADLVNEQKSCIPNSVFRLAHDCSSVAICRHNGRTEVINCGVNTAYNAEQGLCVAKYLALC